MSSQPTVIRVLHLYDEYLNIYADRGNIAVLTSRAQWRGYRCDVQGFAIGDSFAAGDFDLIYVGGGQDRDQRMIAEHLSAEVGEAIRQSVEQGAALLAVCGGYQLLGHHYHDTAGITQSGCGLFDLTTQAADTRLIGNISIDAVLPKIGAIPEQQVRITGFENHAGRTILGDDARPLGTVVAGFGNDGSATNEGCIVGRAIGTYLHGPLLPRNPTVADWLLAAALAHAGGDDAVQEWVAAVEASTGRVAPIDSVATTARDVLHSRALAEHR